MFRPLLIFMLMFGGSATGFAQQLGLGSSYSPYIDSDNFMRPDSCVGPECREVDGKLNGTCFSYWPDGAVKTKGVYRNDTISGFYRSWFENGKIEEERSLTKDNQDVTIVYYWPSGKMKKVVMIEEGQASEVLTWFEEDGLYQQSQRVDSATVILTEYRTNGELRFSGDLVNGEPAGLWRIYNENGELCATKDLSQSGPNIDDLECP